MNTIFNLIADNAIITLIIAAPISAIIAYLCFFKFDGSTNGTISFLAGVLMIGGFLAGGFLEIVCGQFTPDSIKSINEIGFMLGLSYFILNVYGIIMLYIGYATTSPFVWLYKKSRPENSVA